VAAFTFKHGDRPLEGFVIQRGVGRGGFGEVYYAVSDGGREVALKYLRENPAVELRGVSHCMNLKSPHLVTIFDVKQSAQGDYFIVMEYVQGPSLRDLLIAEPNGLGAQKAAFFVRELAKGLSYLHERGIVHRDLKPGNVFYEDGYVKIGDYGLSKFISVSRHSAQTASIGTVHYMAPEVGSGHYHRGIDIYALGVMLYEMLLGRVPYDGATMGEVLMKHLTAQPEVDALPEPFGRVIRKALAKDPKDRYQTVDEMAEELLGVADVQESLAGFNPQSLSAAARQAFDPMDSPLFSPNPPPPPPLGEVPGPLGRRFDRIGAKVAKRVEQLERKHGRRTAPRGAAPFGPGAAGETTRKHRLIAILLVFGIATALGMLLVVTGYGDDTALSAAFSVAMMTAGVFASRKVGRWLGQAAQPPWVQRLVTLGCCGPLLAIALAPMLEHTSRGGPAVLLALIVTALFVDWEKRLECGAAGEMKAGHAFTGALCAFILTAILSNGRSDLMFLAAGVAAATSFAVQGVAWFVVAEGLVARRRSGTGNGVDAPQTPGAAAAYGRSTTDTEADSAESTPQERTARAAQFPFGGEAHRRRPISIPLAIPVDPDAEPARMASGSPLPSLRHVVTRSFWSVLAFALLAGAVIAFLSTVMLEHVSSCAADQHVALTICAVCASMMVFALRKTTLRRRPGFWRETLRPFLQSLAAIGISAPIIALGIEPWPFSDEDRLIAVSFLVVSSLLFIVLLFVRGGRAHQAAPFLLDPAAGDPLHRPGPGSGAALSGEPLVVPTPRPTPSSEADPAEARTL
jgi:hypothetical protein